VARYHYTRATRAALLDQVLARVPGLTAQDIRMEGTATDVWLTVPDAIPEPLVAAVVAAHDAAALDAARAQEATDAATARTVVVQAAQTAAGVNLTALTPVQVRALLAVLLHKAGALNPDGTVRPPTTWV